MAAEQKMQDNMEELTTEELQNTKNEETITDAEAGGSEDQKPAKSQDNGEAENAKMAVDEPRPADVDENNIHEMLLMNEDYFRVVHPDDLDPFSRYYFREWSEVAHLLMPELFEEVLLEYAFPKAG